MTHVHGSYDRDLHNEDGTHRTTSPSANGHLVALYEARIARHMEAHRIEQGERRHKGESTD